MMDRSAWALSLIAAVVACAAGAMRGPVAPTRRESPRVATPLEPSTDSPAIRPIRRR